MRADAADDAIGAGRHLEKRHIRDRRHDALLAWDWLSMWTARGVAGQLVHPVLDLVVNAALEDIGKLVGGSPIIFHDLDEKHFCQAVPAQGRHGDLLTVGGEAYTS